MIFNWFTRRRQAKRNQRINELKALLPEYYRQYIHFRQRLLEEHSVRERAMWLHLFGKLNDAVTELEKLENTADALKR